MSQVPELPPTLNPVEPTWGREPAGQDSQEGHQQTSGEHGWAPPAAGDRAAELERQLAQKEAELGVYRDQLLALRDAPNPNDNEASDELASIIEQATQAAENGGNVVETLVRGLEQHLSKKTEMTIQSQHAQTQRIDRLQNEVLSRNPDADALRDTLRQVYAERPYLVNLDGSDEDIKRGVQDVIDLARIKAGTANAQRRPVQLDPGTGGRVSRPQTGKTERWQELQDKAVRSGRMQDWKDAVRARMFGK